MEEERSTSLQNRILRKTGWAVLIFLGILLCLSLLIQITFVQNWTVNRITEKISRDLNATVSIGQIKLDFFNDLVVDHLLILDEESDTLLYSRKAYFDLYRPMRGLLQNVLTFQEIALTDSRCYLKTDASGRTNYQFLLDYISKGQKQAVQIETGDSTLLESDQFYLVFSPTSIDLSKITFDHRNDQSGKHSYLSLARVTTDLHRIRVDDPLHFDNITLMEPIFELEKYEPPTPEIVIEEISKDESKQITRRPRRPISLLIDELEISGGEARVYNPDKMRRGRNPRVIDFNNGFFHSINVLARDFIWQGDQGIFTIAEMSVDTDEGFRIEQFACEEISIQPEEILLNNYQLKTPESLLANRLSFRYLKAGNISSFEDQVVLDGNFQDSYVALNDLMYFTSSLHANEFFQLNGREKIRVAGRVRGPINDLECRDFTLAIADKAEVGGYFDLENITRPGKEHLSLALGKASAEVTTLRQLVPGFNPPENFDKLGRLEFSGEFEGSFKDFIASGDLKTDLGSFESDLHIFIPDSGIAEASYRGNLKVIDFDLRHWMESEKYGLASFSAMVRNGKNLDLDNAFANLYASLDHFHFNGYNYKKIILQGELNKSFFDGELFSNDPNLDLDFSGSIDYQDSVPHFDFSASIDHLDLHALNLTPKSISASGEIDFDFSYHDLYHLDGFAQGYDLQVVNNDHEYNLDTITLLSHLNRGFDRLMQVQSNILDLDLRGSFDLQSLPKTFKALVQNKHPQFAHKFDISSPLADSLVTDQDFIFNIVLEDSKGLQKIADASLADFNQIELTGFFNNQGNDEFAYRIVADAPVFEFRKNKLNNVHITLNGENEKSDWEISIDEVWLGQKVIRPLGVQGTLVSDSLHFAAQSSNVANILKSLDLAGLFYLNQGYYQIDLANSSFELLNEPWQILPNNYVQVGEKYLKTENMVFLSDDSYIRLSSPGDNSLNLEAEKIDISFLNDFFPKKQLRFTGDAYANLHFANIFEPDKVTYQLSIDTLTINQDNYGSFTTSFAMPDLHSRADLTVELSADDKQLTAGGYFLLPTTRNKNRKLSFYDINIGIDKYPIAIAEYFIGHSISESTGTFDAALVLSDEDGKPALNGEVILDGSTKLDYLGTTYSMDKQTVKITPSMFDFSGTEFFDELGNPAQFSGGITHSYLKNPGLNLTIDSDHFMLLNTSKEDNNLYYGKGIGQGKIDITGDFVRGNIRVRATTGEGSKIFIPVDYDYSTGEHFIKYVFNEDSLVSRDASAELRGTQLDMQLTITPEAEMQIIFDEFSGDIIKGTGNGNLTLTLERGNNFQITGQYEIEEGEYLYTLLDFINKPFSIERGGLISWSGDPLAADLNIKATYTGLKVPPRNLIAEYFEGRNNRAAELADISTQVNLVLGLQGILSQPEIDFDIQFPEIEPSLRNYTDSKLRILREDVSELNRQVYGLLFFNSFLPPSINLDITATTVNTLSEFLTSQLSNYVAAYITEGVEEVDYISGVDFYFDYNFYRSEDFIQGTETGVKTGSEFALAPNIRFFDNRLAFSPGASIVEGTVLQGSTFIGTDVKLDFFLTDDKRLKLSLFYKRFPSLSGGRNKLGLGFRFSRQYDSFGDIFRKKKEEKPTESPPADAETRINLEQ